jgi:hypothetical protein
VKTLDRKIYLVAATALALAGGVALFSFWRGGTATSEATKIIGAAESMAAFPDLADPDKVGAQFSLPLRVGVRTQRPANCPGHPVQASQAWQSAPSGAQWFISDTQPKPRATFLLQIENQPAVCPSDPVSYPIQAQFLNVEAWHCIRLPDLGPMVTPYNTTYQGSAMHIMTRSIDRADGRKARLEIGFRCGGDNNGCLHSVSISIPNQ